MDPGKISAQTLKQEHDLSDSPIDRLARAAITGDVAAMKAAIADGADPTAELTREGQCALECVQWR